MMNRYFLTDEQWSIIYPLLQQHLRGYVGNPESCRVFLNAVLWLLRSGSQWRSLPREYGQWNSVFKRYDRWAKVGVWDTLFKEVQRNADYQEGSIDSTVVRAHACAAGAKKAGVRQKHSDVPSAALAVKSLS